MESGVIKEIKKGTKINVQLHLNKTFFQPEEPSGIYAWAKLVEPNNCIIECIGATGDFKYQTLFYPKEYTNIKEKGKYDGWVYYSNHEFTFQEYLDNILTNVTGVIKDAFGNIIWRKDEQIYTSEISNRK
jgi:hypothetical protein